MSALMRVTLFHPKLDQTVEVVESQVPVLEKSGWQRVDDAVAAPASPDIRPENIDDDADLLGDEEVFDR